MDETSITREERGRLSTGEPIISYLSRYAKEVFIQTSGKQMINEAIDHDRGIVTPQGL